MFRWAHAPSVGAEPVAARADLDFAGNDLGIGQAHVVNPREHRFDSRPHREHTPRSRNALAGEPVSHPAHDLALDAKAVDPEAVRQQDGLEFRRGYRCRAAVWRDIVASTYGVDAWARRHLRPPQPPEEKTTQGPGIGLVLCPYPCTELWVQLV